MSLFNRFSRRRNGSLGTGAESDRVKRRRVLGMASDRAAAQVEHQAGMEPLESRILFAVPTPVLQYTFNTDDPNDFFVANTGTSGTVGIIGSSLTTGQTPDPFRPQFVNDGTSPAGGQFLRFFGNRVYQGAGGRIETGVQLQNSLGTSTAGSAISFWIRIPTAQAAGNDTIWGAPGVTGVEASGNATDGFWGSQSANGSIRIARGDGSISATRATVADGNWHQIVQTANLTTGVVRTYMDGRFESQATSQTGNKGSVFTAIGAVTTVASDASTVQGYNYFNGDLDDIRIYNTELSLQDVGSISTAPPPANPNGNTLPLAVSNLTINAGLSSASLTFTGLSNATAYNVYRKGPTDANFVLVSTRPGDTGNITYTNTGLAGGQTYQYQVTAVNGAGEGPAATGSATTSPPTPTSGVLSAFYYNTAFWGANSPRPTVAGGITLASDAAVVGTVSNVSFDYGNGSPANGINADNFGTAFVGTFVTPQTPATGAYTILAFSDDESFVFVNGQLVSGDEGGHGIPGNDAAGIASIETQVPITLAGGATYNIMVLQGDTGGGAGVFLRWKIPGSASFTSLPTFPFSGIRSNIPNATGGNADGTPAAATGLTVTQAATDLGSSYAIFNWNDNATNEIRYELNVTGPNNYNSTTTVPINTKRIVLTGLTASTAYTATLRAVNFFGVTNTTLAFSTAAADPVPAAVTGLVARNLATVQLSFTDNSLSENSFLVQRRVFGSGNAFVTVTGGSITSTSKGGTGSRIKFSDPAAGLVAGTRYEYRVTAVNATGESAAVTTSITFTPALGNGFRTYNYNNSTFGGNPVVIDNVSADVNFGNNGPSTAIAGVTPGSSTAIPTDNFTINLEGEFTAEFSETYTFRTTSDDGVALRLVDKLTGAVLIDYDNLGASRGLAANGGFDDTPGTAALVAGRRYLLQGRQREGGGGAGFRFGWSSPSIVQEVIPKELLFLPTIPVSAVQAVGGALNAARTQVNVTFADRSFGETGFQVFRSTNPLSFPNTPVTGGTLASSVGLQTTGRTTFADTEVTTLSPGIYYYMIRTTGPSGSTADSAPFAVLTRPFDPTDTGLTFNGPAVVQGGADGNIATVGDNTVRLTPPNSSNQASSFFTTNPRPVTATAGSGDTTFSAGFDFNVPTRSTQPGEGFAFVIQPNSATALGANGAGLGYQGIANALAVKFDFNGGGSGGDPAGLSAVNVYSRGTVDDFDFPTSPVSLGGGTTYHVDIVYNDPAAQSDAAFNTLTVTIKDAAQTSTLFTQTFQAAQFVASGGNSTFEPLNLNSILGTSNAYVGFTGGTGGNTSEQQIRSFTFNGANIPLQFNAPVGVSFNPSNTSGVIYDKTTQTLVVNPGGGTVSLASDLATLNPKLNVIGLGTGSSVVFNSNQHLGALNLIGGATASVSSVGTSRSATNHRLLVVDSLSIDQRPNLQSTLDLADNDLVIHNGDASAMRLLLRAGYNGGAWNGTGIRSSESAKPANQLVTALGYLRNNGSTGVPAVTKFGPGNVETVTSTDVLVKYTYQGDVDLNGLVDPDDYFYIDINFPKGSGSTWGSGDLDYNGTTDPDDYFYTDFNFAKPTKL